MNKREQAVAIFKHYFIAAFTGSNQLWREENSQEVSQLVDILLTTDIGPIGRPGSGICICRASPEWQENAARRMGFKNWLDEWSRGKAGVATLDHRCSKHGEAAQPKLWGRHKTLELPITANQWDSLGVTYETEETTEENDDAQS